MAQTAFSIRMDEGLKRDFSQFCENIGMTMSTAFVVFAKAALRSRKIPFEIYDYTGSPESEKASIRLEAKRAFESMRADNAEIARARKIRRERQDLGREITRAK